MEEQKEKRALAEQQLLTYLRKDGVFSRETVLRNARSMPAAEWWLMYGGELKELQLVAVRTLGQIAGAGAAERGHKEMNFIKSKLRNRLSIDSTRKLVYTRHNLNMLERVRGVNFKPEAVEWLDLDAQDEDLTDVDLHDPWQEARQEAEELYDEHKFQYMVTSKSLSRSMSSVASRHIPPTANEGIPLGAPDVGDVAHDGTYTRAGRTLRRPGSLADFN